MFLGFGLGVRGGGVDSLYGFVGHCKALLLYIVVVVRIHTLPNQSDISDLVEKSFSSCC